MAQETSKESLGCFFPTGARSGEGQAHESPDTELSGYLTASDVRTF